MGRLEGRDDRDRTADADLDHIVRVAGAKRLGKYPGDPPVCIRLERFAVGTFRDPHPSSPGDGGLEVGDE